MANATARSNGAASVKTSQDAWKEKYRLTMSNLLAASLARSDEVDFGQIDKYVRMILDAKYDGEEAPF